MPNEWHTPLEVPGNRLPETGSRRKLLNVRGYEKNSKRKKIKHTKRFSRSLKDHVFRETHTQHNVMYILRILHYNLKARSMDAKIGRATEEAKTKIELTLVICRELSDLGGTQRQQNLKERSCTEAAPNEKTQNGAEKTSAEKRTSAEILGRGRKGNSIRPAIGSE
ncbi:hypothetical protein V6N13_060148 [Hibiscus sabdariffa]